ncbi:MAG: ArgE/DapE family deacylase [Paracoccaceae bacterium]
MTGMKDRILAAVADGFDEQVAFLRDLAGCASLREQEASAQDMMAAAFKARGYATDRFEIDVPGLREHPGFSPATVDYSDMRNVVATHTPRNAAGRSLILNGHVDVVPQGPEALWSSPPFAPRIEGEWMYGRGAGDMKAGLVANLFALDALRRAGVQPAAQVHLQSVVEEECTGNGALACLVRGYDAEAALIPEPFGETLVRANVGTLWFRVRIAGHPVHVVEAGAGGNAIEAAFRLMQELRRLEEEWNARKAGRAHFDALEHPINLNFGRIQGGDWASSVPAWCDFDCRIAIFPGEHAADAAREIEERIAAFAATDPVLSRQTPQVEWNGFFAEGYVLEEGSDAEQALARAHRAATDAPLTASVQPCYLDARVFALYQHIPCLVYGPLAENIHGFDERVNLPSVKRVTGAIALFVADWCGLEPVDE